MIPPCLTLEARINGKVEQSWEFEYRPPLHLSVVAIEKGAFRSPSKSFTFTLFTNGLVSLFNGLSTFIGYLKPKVFS